jgi:hypothetical protein
VLVVPLVCGHDHHDVNAPDVVLHDGGAGHVHLEHVDLDHEHDDAWLHGVVAGGSARQQFGCGEHDRVGFRRVERRS